MNYGKYTAEEIISRIDHTLLKPECTSEQIRLLCDEGVEYHTASVCIPASYVRYAKEYVGDKLKVCTVIGFPNGYSTLKSKCFEAADAVNCGADEIDMVINIGALKDRRDEYVQDEINRVKKFCDGRILKVIVETCLLTEEEKIRVSRIVSTSDADFIKTSTGFSKYGATFEDVALLSKYCVGKRVKAAGGIKSIDDAVRFMDLGADRLGTSSLLGMIVSDTKA